MFTAYISLHNQISKSRNSTMIQDLYIYCGTYFYCVDCYGGIGDVVAELFRAWLPNRGVLVLIPMSTGILHVHP